MPLKKEEKLIENHHFAISNIVINLGKAHQRILNKSCRETEYSRSLQAITPQISYELEKSNIQLQWKDLVISILTK